MLKYCFSYSSHRDEQNEMQQAYVWVTNNEISILAILTTLTFQVGGQYWSVGYTMRI